MKNNTVISFVKTTLIGGVFFLIPVMLLLFVFNKALVVFRKLVAPIVEIIPIETIGGIHVSRIMAVIILLLLCFLVGLLAKTQIASWLKKWAENTILTSFPGYSFIKGMGGTMTDLHSDSLKKVVLVDLEETWQIGFLMEQIDDEINAVYIPGAPNPLGGDVIFVKKSRLRFLDIPTLDAMKISSNLGVGSKKKLKGEIYSTIFD